MKRILLLVALVVATSLFCKHGFSQISRQGTGNYTTFFSQPAPNTYEITFSVPTAELTEVTKAGTTYCQISPVSSVVTTRAGWAELPIVSAAIQLPANKDVDIAHIAATDYVDIPVSHPLLPSRGIFYRNQNPASIPYHIDPASLQDAFYPEQNITLDAPFIVRDVRGVSLRFCPFQYNPITRTLRHYRSITITLQESNRLATNPLAITTTSINREAEAMYKSLFLNYEPSRQPLAYSEKGDLLVITTATYENAVEPYIQWKREMGYLVTKEVVANVTNVTSLIQTAYNNNRNLMYVQLVGDWTDIRSNTITSDYTSCPADPMLGCVSGNDNFPDLAIGRFSCNTAAQATVQVEKAINYEKNPNMEAGWRETFIGVASDEGEGSGDDNEIDYTHIQRIFSQRLAPFTYQTEKGNYGSSANATNLARDVNAGASTIAYCGHGSETSFVTTGYSNNNVNASTNGDKLPFIVAVACVNGAFHKTTDCFAEAWLKKENGGAVVTLMSTINQPWTPPQRGQDYFFDILTGGFNYNQYSSQAGIETNEQRTHWGAIVINAFNLALTESSTESDIETFRTWTTFGDVTLQLRTKQPVNLALSNRAIMQGVPFTTIVTANGQPVADALVCISQEGNYFSAYSDANGLVTIPHDLLPGDVLLVATAFNTTTIYETMPCSAANVPYLTLNSYTPQQISSGDMPFLTLTMENVGGVATTDYATISVTCNDPLIRIIDGTGYAAPMAAQNGTASLSNEFQIAVDPDITTGHIATFQWNATLDTFHWNGTFTLTALGSDCVAPTGLTVTASGNSSLLSWNDESSVEEITISDDAEDHTYGTINSAGSTGWTYIDGDGGNTGTFSGVSFTNVGSPMAFIVLDDEQMTGSSVVTAHSGDKYFADAYARSNSWGQSSIQNDDWMISPELAFNEPFTFSFYARSYSSTYANEQFVVAYSTDGNAATDFTNLSNVITTTASWQLYTYTVPANAKYVAIHCVSNDQYMFCVDDIVISGRAVQGQTCNIYRNGELIAQRVAGGSYTDTNLPDGTYCYTITYNCDNDYESVESEMFCVTIGEVAPEPCDVPAGLSVVASSSQIALSWEAVTNAIAYKIYRNGNLLTTTSTNGYTDANVSAETIYNYAVRSVCAGGESDLSNTVSAATNIANYTHKIVHIYPNPAAQQVQISGDNLKEISLYSAVGSLIKKVTVTEKITQIPIQNLVTGIYFVKVATKNGNVCTEKLIVKH